MLLCQITSYVPLTLYDVIHRKSRFYLHWKYFRIYIFFCYYKEIFERKIQIMELLRLFTTWILRLSARQNEEKIHRQLWVRGAASKALKIDAVLGTIPPLLHLPPLAGKECFIAIIRQHLRNYLKKREPALRIHLVYITLIFIILTHNIFGK